MIGKQPDDSAARRHDRIRINCAASANHGKDLVFFKWERDPNLPRDIERVAIGVILKIDARIEFNSSAGMIMDDVFVGEERMNRLQVIGQSIVRPAEIESLVFNANAQIPVSGNEKPMSIAEIVVERIAVAELPPIVLKIAVSSIDGFVIEDLGGVLVLLAWRWSGLQLQSGPGKDR